jgi:hypothetical protein
MLTSRLLSPIELTQQEILPSASGLDSTPYQTLIDTRQNWNDIKEQLQNTLSKQKSQLVQNMKKRIHIGVKQQTLYASIKKDSSSEPYYSKNKSTLKPSLAEKKKSIRRSLEHEEVSALEKSFALLNIQTFSDLPQLQNSLFKLVKDLNFYADKKNMSDSADLLNKCYQLLKDNPPNENKHPEKYYKENWLIFYKYKKILDSVMLTVFQEKSRWSCGLFCCNETALGVRLQEFINTSDDDIIRKKFFENQSTLSYNTIRRSVLPLEHSQRASTFFSASFRADNFQQINLQLSALEGRHLSTAPYVHSTYGAI